MSAKKHIGRMMLFTNRKNKPAVRQIMIHPIVCRIIVSKPVTGSEAVTDPAGPFCLYGHGSPGKSGTPSNTTTADRANDSCRVFTGGYGVYKEEPCLN